MRKYRKLPISPEDGFAIEKTVQNMNLQVQARLKPTFVGQNDGRRKLSLSLIGNSASSCIASSADLDSVCSKRDLAAWAKKCES